MQYTVSKLAQTSRMKRMILTLLRITVYKFSPDLKLHSLSGVEVVRDHSTGLSKVILILIVFEKPGHLDVRPTDLLVLLHDDLLVSASIRLPISNIVDFPGR